MPVDIREASVDAVVPHGQSLVVYAEQVEHRCIDIVDLRRIFPVHGLVAPLVTFPMGDPSLDTPACKPVGKDIRVVIPPLACLTAGHAAELGRPVYDGVLK